MFGLLSIFFPRWVWQATAGGRAHKMWRTAGTCLPQPCQMAQSLWALSAGTVTHQLLQSDAAWPVCGIHRELRNVDAWAGASRSPGRSWGLYHNEGRGNSGFYSSLYLAVTFWGTFSWKISRCGLIKIQTPRLWRGLCHSSCVMIKPICALSLSGFSTAGRHHTVERRLR